MENNKNVKAIGLISGGLDSIIAAKVIKDLGVEVHAVCYLMPWETGAKKKRIIDLASSIGIEPIFKQLDNDFIALVRNPNHGYGTAINPCVDCKIHMLKRATKLMNELEADFIFTGEVLGQRPLSQVRHKLELIEKMSGLKGRLLRPLSAKLLEPTIPEREGLIDRNKLLKISGRGRKTQMDMAEEFNIKKYSQPAGGCLLTDEHFEKRLKDAFDFGDVKIEDMKILSFGRHFRAKDNFKIILGRDKKENDRLIELAKEDETLMQFPDNMGGTVLIRGGYPGYDILSVAGGLMQHFSKKKGLVPQKINYWLKKDPSGKSSTVAKKLSEKEIESMQI